MKQPLVLVVDDEHKILRFIRANLLASDYQVVTATGGYEALKAFETHLPDLILLDVMLPDMDGFETCRRIREVSDTPVLMVTAKGDPDDAVRGLNAGADDYIAKPFDVEELLARVRAVLRRASPGRATEATPILSVGPITLDHGEYQVKVNGNEVRLTPTEFRLLALFLGHPGKVLSHEFILTSVWGPEYRDETHYLRVSIGRLRGKLKAYLENQDLIVTLPTVGYKLCVTKEC